MTIENGTAIVVAYVLVSMRDHRVPVSRVHDRMVHWSAAPAPPRTARRRVTYRAAVARWSAARITLRQGIRVVHDTGQQE